MTVNEILTAALRRLGVLEASEVPRTVDADATLDAANAWIDALALDDLYLYRIARHVFNLSSGVASYTIGPGATFDTPRPVDIYRCGVIVDPTATTPREVPLGPPLAVDEYAGLVAKTVQALYPSRVYYDPTFTTAFGTVIVHPVPNSSTPDLVLYLPERLSELGAMDDDVDLPPGYRRLLVTNIAVEAAPIFGQAVAAELVAAALESRTAIQRANLRPISLDLPIEAPGRTNVRFDIEVG